MKKMKLLSLIVLMMMSMLVIQGSAIAAPQIGLDPTGNGIYTTYADIWTSATDTGLSTGFDVTRTNFAPDAINMGAPLGGAYDTEFILQAAIGTMSLNGGLVTPAGLNSSFELTFETLIPETVTQQFVLGTTAFTNFLSGEDTSALLNLYIDNIPPGTHDPGPTSPPPVPGTVSGYGDDDGIGAILTAHLFSASASFTAPLPGTTLGTGSYNARFIIDSVNSDYIDVALGAIFDIEETGTLNIPPFYFPFEMWNGTDVGDGFGIDGIALKYDGSASFSAVPEPSTLLLLGMGLIGLAGLGRKLFDK